MSAQLLPTIKNLPMAADSYLEDTQKDPARNYLSPASSEANTQCNDPPGDRKRRKP